MTDPPPAATGPGDPRSNLERMLAGDSYVADDRAPARPIVLGDDVWLGGGAVVTRELPPGVVVVGNPAQVVRDLRSG